MPVTMKISQEDEGLRANILYAVFLIPVGSPRALVATLYPYYFFL